MINYGFLGQWDTVVSSPYTLYLDQWGTSGASGSTCANLISQSGTTISWKTTWNWNTGSGGVKVFPNIGLNSGINKQLSAISSIPVSSLLLGRPHEYPRFTCYLPFVVVLVLVPIKHLCRR
jgi:hypothetical protein